MLKSKIFTFLMLEPSKRCRCIWKLISQKYFYLSFDTWHRNKLQHVLRAFIVIISCGISLLIKLLGFENKSSENESISITFYVRFSENRFLLFLRKYWFIRFVCFFRNHQSWEMIFPTVSWIKFPRDTSLFENLLSKDISVIIFEFSEAINYSVN